MEARVQFRDYLNDRLRSLSQSLKSSEWEFISARVEPWEAEREIKLLEQGQVCRRLYFLSEGLLRYGVLTNGVDRTNYFTRPGQIFTGSQSFASQQPSPEFIETILPSCGLRISYAHVQELYAELPVWNRLILDVLRQVNGDIQELMQAGKAEGPEQRYRRMLVEEPDLVREVPIKILAGYL